MNKIIRTICFFSKKPDSKIIQKLNEIEDLLKKKGFEIQTKRICTKNINCIKLKEKVNDNSIILGIGKLNYRETKKKLGDFIKAGNVSFNLDLTNEEITNEHAKILFKIIKEKPEATFCFAYTFNNSPASPYFPSAEFKQEGFAIGLQSTDLAEKCNSLEEWLNKMKEAWNEIYSLFKKNKEFLGIDSSIAPTFEGKESFINFIKKLNSSFNDSILTDTYIKITNFIKKENPKPIGLCGLMIPCLEDFELTKEYELGNFMIERNLFLSLHSGLGIDTYPIGINENIEKVTNILKLVQGLSNKYNKPLSIRFVSDGKAKIGEKTNFKNQYLKDVVVRKL